MSLGCNDTALGRLRRSLGQCWGGSGGHQDVSETHWGALGGPWGQHEARRGTGGGLEGTGREGAGALRGTGMALGGARPSLGALGQGHREHWAALWDPAPVPLRCQATPAGACAGAATGGRWHGENYSSRHAPRGAASTPAPGGTTTPGGPCGGGDYNSRRAAGGGAERVREGPPWRRAPPPPGRRGTWRPTSACGSTGTSSAPTSWRE